jgi:hypothetical protein
VLFRLNRPETGAVAWCEFVLEFPEHKVPVGENPAMPQVLWMITLTVSLCATIISAAIGDPPTLMAMTGLVSFVLALVAIRAHRELEVSGASQAIQMASIIRYMGLIWMWGALGLLVTYGMILGSTWDSWPYYFAAFAAASIACLLFAASVDRDASLGHVEDQVLRLGHYLSVAQLMGMLSALVMLCKDPSRMLLSAENPDWVANNIFVAGAVALTALSAYAWARQNAAEEKASSAA